MTIVFLPRSEHLSFVWRALQKLSFSLLFSSFSCSSFISGSSSGMLSYGGLNERIKLSLHRCGPHEGHRLRPFVLSRSILLPCLIILICALLVSGVMLSLSLFVSVITYILLFTHIVASIFFRVFVPVAFWHCSLHIIVGFNCH